MFASYNILSQQALENYGIKQIKKLLDVSAREASDFELFCS